MNGGLNVVGTYTIGNKVTCLSVFKDHVVYYKTDSIIEQVGKVEYFDLLDNFTSRRPDKFNPIIDNLDKSKLELDELDLCIRTEFDSAVSKIITYSRFFEQSIDTNSSNYFKNFWFTRNIDSELEKINVEISKKFIQITSKIDFRLMTTDFLDSVYKLIGSNKRLNFTNYTVIYFLGFYVYRRLNYGF